ncbi:uncharacterized protein VNE69_04040 [Vairimorpha necatrix]|uniref:Uncharacterized protein n=1 Tax=Vairimorpha necatrix TaxID=6039 RepID=A0AAX4JBH1_9MICR
MNNYITKRKLSINTREYLTKRAIKYIKLKLKKNQNMLNGKKITEKDITHFKNEVKIILRSTFKSKLNDLFNIFKHKVLYRKILNLYENENELINIITVVNTNLIIELKNEEIKLLSLLISILINKNIIKYRENYLQDALVKLFKSNFNIDLNDKIMCEKNFKAINSVMNENDILEFLNGTSGEKMFYKMIKILECQYNMKRISNSEINFNR